MTDLQQVTGRIHSTENFGTVDGPDVRFVIFVQGCRMRCQFCHNPDTWKIKSGTERTVGDVLDEAERFRQYWGKDGGITVSGGEPLLQIDFVLALFKGAKRRGIHTCLDTCGQPFTYEEPFFSKFNELLEYTDLILLDIKHIKDDKHKVITGHSNQSIIALAKYLAEQNKPVWIRHVLVPTLSDFDEDLHELDDFIQTLDNVERVEVLPYHTMGRFKWDELGIPYKLDGVESPTEEQVKNAKRILEHRDI